MNWISRKIHLYNVTMGLYMLDWWERYLFSILSIFSALGSWRPSEYILIVVLLWFICYNTWRYATDFFNGYDSNACDKAHLALLFLLKVVTLHGSVLMYSSFLSHVEPKFLDPKL
ncbi:hypothetical protein Taro_012677 [Colocasia esculenta]|uniref:Uncharacterized protein n=1 Tax=Colocasia esculenta TaxID=4460 RepID=A0A843U9E4_COLES|nr:hypothetical protein [Colocasia esculenta]